MFQSLKDIAQKAGFIIEFTTIDSFITINLSTRKTYIRFSSLLEFLEKTQLIYTKQNDPLINFDYKIGKSYMITNKWVISPNPNILLINPGTVSLSEELAYLGDVANSNKNILGISTFLLGGVNIVSVSVAKYFIKEVKSQFNILDSLPEFKLTDNGFNSEIGDIMNIYLEVNKVFDILLENTNEKGKVSIFKFLDSICSVINNTLGNLSSIAPFIDESTNTLSIIEEGELPHKDKLLTNKINVPLQLYGYSNINTTNPTSSFVKSFNLKTEITNDLATMVTIGAQASGEIVKGIDATAFASWNRGLIDRITPIKKADTKETVTEEKTDEDKKRDLLKKYETGLGNYVAMLDAYSGKKINEDDIASFTSGLKAIIDYNKELIKLEKETKNSGKTIGVTQPGFLPINLNLTLDGISGPRILHQFEAEGRFLPHPIPDTLTFLIKGLNHKISNNVWTTTIDSLSVPKFVKSSTSTTTSNNTTSNNTTSNNTPQQGPTPNADRLRKTLTQLKYQEKGEEISNGGDITAEMADLAIAVFNQISISYPTINIIVTGGNDNYHQQLNYNSRHKKGNSVDFVLLPATSPNVANVKKILQGFAAGGNGFVRFLDEYGDPTAKATGQHFHLSYGQGTEGNATLNASIALSQNNQIETYIV